MSQRKKDGAAIGEGHGQLRAGEQPGSAQADQGLDTESLSKGFIGGFCPIFQHSQYHARGHHPSRGVLCLGT